MLPSTEQLFLKSSKARVKARVEFTKYLSHYDLYVRCDVVFVDKVHAKRWIERVKAKDPTKSDFKITLCK